MEQNSNLSSIRGVHNATDWENSLLGKTASTEDLKENILELGV